MLAAWPRGRWSVGSEVVAIHGGTSTAIPARCCSRRVVGCPNVPRHAIGWTPRPRARTRAAVIDAVFEVVLQGKVPPHIEDVAEHAGVSVSTIFRSFDGAPDMQHQALESFQVQFHHLFAVGDADRDRAERSRSHARGRMELYSVAGGLMRIGRARALDHEPMVSGLARLRGHLADQTRQRFAVELKRLTPPESANLVALVDATTSPEAYEVMGAAHVRTPRQITSTWTTALEVLLDHWAPGAPVEPVPKENTR